jgi:hypothetical protein
MIRINKSRHNRTTSLCSIQGQRKCMLYANKRVWWSLKIFRKGLMSNDIFSSHYIRESVK